MITIATIIYLQLSVIVRNELVRGGCGFTVISPCVCVCVFWWSIGGGDGGTAGNDVGSVNSSNHSHEAQIIR